MLGALTRVCVLVLAVVSAAEARQLQSKAKAMEPFNGTAGIMRVTGFTETALIESIVEKDPKAGELAPIFAKRKKIFTDTWIYLATDFTMNFNVFFDAAKDISPDLYTTVQKEAATADNHIDFFQVSRYSPGGSWQFFVDTALIVAKKLELPKVAAIVNDKIKQLGGAEKLNVSDYDAVVAAYDAMKQEATAVEPSFETYFTRVGNNIISQMIQYNLIDRLVELDDPMLLLINPPAGSNVTTAGSGSSTDIETPPTSSVSTDTPAPTTSTPAPEATPNSGSATGSAGPTTPAPTTSGSSTVVMHLTRTLCVVAVVIASVTA